MLRGRLFDILRMPSLNAYWGCKGCKGNLSVIHEAVCSSVKLRSLPWKTGIRFQVAPSVLSTCYTITPLPSYNSHHYHHCANRPLLHPLLFIIRHCTTLTTTRVGTASYFFCFYHRVSHDSHHHRFTSLTLTSPTATYHTTCLAPPRSLFTCGTAAIAAMDHTKSTSTPVAFLAATTGAQTVQSVLNRFAPERYDNDIAKTLSTWGARPGLLTLSPGLLTTMDRADLNPPSHPSKTTTIECTFGEFLYEVTSITE